jgi:hypothetical protein
LCGAHLLRELEAISEEPGQGWAAGMGELLGDVKLVADRARAAGSGCWRTVDGAAAFLALRSYVATARKHGMNPLVVLCQLFAGRSWRPAPASGRLPAPL